MTPWQEFYNTVKDQDWPACANEDDFVLLPDWIQYECQHIHGYQIGQYKNQQPFVHRSFPIKSATACQLKWTWSTIYLTTGHTASCHRTNHHLFDTNSFNFHNTELKLQDRRYMLEGQWPQQGCEYCKRIEEVGGQSDRLTNLDMPGIYSPHELAQNPNAIEVTPRILEVYFDNLCNLKCVYCGPHFSSAWNKENTNFGPFTQSDIELRSFTIHPQNQDLKNKLFSWLEKNSQHLTQFNILGGEPLFQPDLDRCLDFFDKHQSPNLELHMFSNLMVDYKRLDDVVSRINTLIQQNKIRNFSLTASLDCWGEPQEYARFPLKLQHWQRNFEHILINSNVRLTIGSTITPLTIVTLPDLMLRIKEWNKVRKIYHYFNSVTSPDFMLIDIYGDRFAPYFEQALAIADYDANTKRYLEGIASQSCNSSVNKQLMNKLLTFLDEMDRRRNLDWRRVFPWLTI